MIFEDNVNKFRPPASFDLTIDVKIILFLLGSSLQKFLTNIVPYYTRVLRLNSHSGKSYMENFYRSLTKGIYALVVFSVNSCFRHHHRLNHPIQVKYYWLGRNTPSLHSSRTFAHNFSLVILHSVFYWQFSRISKFMSYLLDFSHCLSERWPSP